MTRGGKREGAGRPPGKTKKRLTIKLDIELLNWLREEVAEARKFNAKVSQASLIEDALKSHYKDRINKFKNGKLDTTPIK